MCLVCDLHKRSGRYSGDYNERSPGHADHCNSRLPITCLTSMASSASRNTVREEMGAPMMPMPLGALPLHSRLWAEEHCISRPEPIGSLSIQHNTRPLLRHYPVSMGFESLQTGRLSRLMMSLHTRRSVGHSSVLKTVTTSNSGLQCLVCEHGPRPTDRASRSAVSSPGVATCA